jgi:urease accessory protein
MPTTTAAARLLPRSLNSGAEDSEQRMNFSIGDGSMLEYLPDSLIPFAGSRHVQRTSFSLGRDATLIWWEVLAHIVRLRPFANFQRNRYLRQASAARRFRP